MNTANNMGSSSSAEPIAARTSSAMPAGTAASWDSAQMAARRSSWTLRPSQAAIDQLLEGVRLTAGGREDLRRLPDPRDLAPLLRSELASYEHELLEGCGVVLIRGLPVDSLTAAERERMYWLIGGLLGIGLSQSLRGDLLGDVINLSDQQSSSRPYQNGGGLYMHSDPVDVVGLLCVRHAKQGGQSRIASALKIHDVLLAERPDLLSRLYDGYVYSRLEEDRGTLAEFTSDPVPVFSRDAAQRVSCFFIPGAIRRAGAAGYPIDPLAQEALDRFVALSQDPELYFDMALETGDIQFLNNRVILHGRTDYEDHPEFSRRRHMLRLWLHMAQWPAQDPRQMYFVNVDHFDRHVRTDLHASL